LLENGLWPLQNQPIVKQNLQLFLNTVPKRVTVDSNIITSITAIQRIVKPGVQCGGYDIRPSQDIKDWYTLTPSTRWDKKIIALSGSVYLDATEWGEILALSSAPYLQGIDEKFEGDTSGSGIDTCGQAFTFGFAEVYHSNDTSEPPNPYTVDYPEHYSLEGYSWDKVFTYRRLYSTQEPVVAGDITLQNWGSGNDFPFGYLLMSKKDAATSVKDDNWIGGINVSTMDAAERLAFGWHYWYKKYNSTVEKKITMAGNVFGTCHGLSKLPYMRDTKRSIGLNDFVIKVTDLTGNATDLTGGAFLDRVATGCYNVDIHQTANCTYPAFMHPYMQGAGDKVLPYFIPFRALTNKKYFNLLVAGKTMAQSFLTNSATRLHPVEWCSGTAAGVAAAYIAANKITTQDAFLQIQKLQPLIEKYTPLKWTINDKLHPN